MIPLSNPNVVKASMPSIGVYIMSKLFAAAKAIKSAVGAVSKGRLCTYILLYPLNSADNVTL